MNVYTVEWFDNLVDNSIEIPIPLLSGGTRIFRGEIDWPPRCITWAYANIGNQITSWEASREDRKSFTSKWINTSLLLTWHKQNKDKCPFCTKKK